MSTEQRRARSNTATEFLQLAAGRSTSTCNSLLLIVFAPPWDAHLVPGSYASKSHTAFYMRYSSIYVQQDLIIISRVATSKRIMQFFHRASSCTCLYCIRLTLHCLLPRVRSSTVLYSMGTISYQSLPWTHEAATQLY